MTDQPAKALRQHDHDVCVREAIASAEAKCAQDGLRFTPSRRKVLKILLEEHQALGAYDVLDRLRADGQNAQPPAAYRALNFLVEHGFAHRLEKKNAFVACFHPEADHFPAFLVCRDCEAVEEAVLPGRTAMDRAARELGFDVERVVFEAEGLCAQCRSDEDQS